MKSFTKSASLMMIASLNDVSAFDTPTNKPLLVAEDSCSLCLKKGYTYVYDQSSNSIAKEPYFKSYSVDQTVPNGKCCMVKANGTYDCTTTVPAKKDIVWETLQYKGLQANDKFCKSIPRLRKIINDLEVLGQDIYTPIFNQYASNLNVYQNSMNTNCIKLIDLIFIKGSTQYANRNPSTNYSVAKAFEIFSVYNISFGVDATMEVFDKFIKNFLAPATPKNMKDNEDLLIDMQTKSAWAWAFSWDLSIQTDKVAKAKINLTKTLEFEGFKQFQSIRTKLIDAYSIRNIKYPEAKKSFEDSVTEMEVYSYYYGKAEVKELRITRAQLDLLKTQAPMLYSAFFTELQSIMNTHKNALKNKTATPEAAMKKLIDDLENVTTWIFFSNKEGSRPILVFRESLKTYKEIDPTYTIWMKLKFTRQNILDGRDFAFYQKQFKIYLREVYYQVNFGKEKWDKLQSLITKSYKFGLYDQTLFDLYAGFYEDAVAKMTTKATQKLKDLELWWFWIDKFKTDDTDANVKIAAKKVWQMKDFLEQLELTNLDTPNNLKRDYFDPRKMKELAVSYKAMLQRGMTTDDKFAFEYVYNEADTFTKKIYDSFWTNLNVTVGDIPALMIKLRKVRIAYGNVFAKALTLNTRRYINGQQSVQAVNNFLDMLIFLHEKFTTTEEKGIRQTIINATTAQGQAYRFSNTLFDFTNIYAIISSNSKTDEVKKTEVTEDFAHQNWSRLTHIFSKDKLLPQVGIITFTSQEQTDYGISQANALALKFKIEALKGFYTGTDINDKIQFYKVLQMIMNKYSKTYTDTAATVVKLDYTFISAYKTMVDKLQEREPPFLKTKISTLFFSKPNKPETVVRMQGILRFNTVVGFRPVEDLLITLQGGSRKVGANTVNDPGINDHFSDYFDERFISTKKIDRTYFYEQKKIIDMFATFKKAPASQRKILKIPPKDGFTTPYSSFYKTIRAIITDANADKKKVGLKYFADLMAFYDKGKFQTPQPVLLNTNISDLMLEIIFYKFGLIKEFQAMGTMFENLGNLNLIVINNGVLEVEQWMDLAVTQDSNTESTKQHKVKMVANLSKFMTKNSSAKEIMLAQKLMWGYHVQNNASLSTTKIEAVVANAAKWNDFFLLESAYSMMIENFESAKYPELRQLLEKAYDFSPSTWNGQTYSASGLPGVKFYADPTYTKMMASRLLNLNSRIFEQIRTNAILYQKTPPITNHFSFLKSDFWDTTNYGIDTSTYSNKGSQMNKFIANVDLNLQVALGMKQKFQFCEDSTDNDKVIAYKSQQLELFRAYLTASLNKYTDSALKIPSEENITVYEELLDDLFEKSCDLEYWNKKSLHFNMELVIKIVEGNLLKATNAKQFPELVTRNKQFRKNFETVAKVIGWGALQEIAEGTLTTGFTPSPLFNTLFKRSVIQKTLLSSYLDLSDNILSTASKQNTLNQFVRYIDVLKFNFTKRPTPIVGAIAERKMARSSQFASNDIALTACPSEIAVCGQKNIVLDDQFTVPVKMSISGFNGLSNSCHWLVKAKCGLPTVEITAMSSTLADQFGLHYVEYQEDGPDVQLNDNVNFKDYPRFASIPEFVKAQSEYPEGELGELVYNVTQYPQGLTFEEKQQVTEFHRYVWASVIESEVKRVQEFRTQYYKGLTAWEKKAVAYNKEVADVENLIESLDNQGWVFQSHANAGLDLGQETNLFSKRVAEMVKAIPSCPVKPKVPEVNINISLEGAKYVSGFGTLTAGEISLKPSDLNSRKSFGVFGQGKGKSKSFTSKPDLKKDDGTTQCRARYIALNLYPKRRTFEQLDTEVLEFTAVAEDNSFHQMNKPGPVRPSVPAKCHEFTPGAQFFIDTLGAAYTKVGMMVSMATLAALTLY